MDDVEIVRLDCPLGKLDILEYMYRGTVLVWSSSPCLQLLVTALL